MRLLLPIAVFLMAPPLLAQDTEFAPIEVLGQSDPMQVDPGRLRAAVKAFASNQAQLAPEAALAFEVVAKPATDLSGMRLKLDNGQDRTIDLPLDATGRFILPAIDTTREKWWIMGNRRAREAYVRPLIRSPGTSATNRRVGDERLLCKVGWAMFKTQVELTARLFIDAAGGACAFGRFGLWSKAARSLAAAEIRDGARTIPIPISDDRQSFKMLIHRKDISNEARILLTYR